MGNQNTLPDDGPRQMQAIGRKANLPKGPDRTGAEPRVIDRSKVTHLHEVFLQQYGSLLRFCRLRIRSEADAEDIVQNAFLAARRAYPDKAADELRPLLFTLVRNLSFNHLKLHWNKRRHGSDVIEATAGFACPQTSTPEKQLMDVQDLAIVEATLSSMSTRRREALKMHRLEGMTYKEIAQRLSVSPTTVKSDVAEAVAELAQAIARAGQPKSGLAD